MAFSDRGKTNARPDRVDLRTFLWPVDHTRSILAAASSAVVTALEYHCNRMNEPPTNLSSMFVHYNARTLKGYPEANRGTNLRDALEAVVAYGACREETWPFDEHRFAEKPTAAAYDEARKFAGVHYAAVDDAFESLALGYPVPFYARMPPDWIRGAPPSGVMRPFTPDERRNAAEHPGHAMTLVGYDKAARTVLARNCWGESWGDKGHCTLSFAMMDVLCPDVAHTMWVITLPTNAKDAESTSAGQQRSVTPRPEPATASTEDLSKRLRDEIRSGLDKDLAEARKRIQDQLRKPGDRQ